MKKLEKLEAIRGLAAIYVLIYHIYGQCFPTATIKIGSFDILQLFIYGNEAVMIFFILSGLVIHYSFSNAKDKSFKLYFFKRAARIYIPLLIVFGSTAILQLIQYGIIIGADPIRLIGNLLMFQDYGFRLRIICQPAFDNTPLWSLSYEWWYYMLFFAVTTYLLKKEKYKTYLYGAIVLMTISYVFYPFFFNRWLLYLIIWWTGREIAELLLKKKSITLKNLRTPISVLVFCFATLCFSYYVLDLEYVGYDYVRFKNITIIIAIALVWYKLKWRFFNILVKPFGVFASTSYTIYISHYFLVIQATYLNFIPNAFVRYSLYVIICFLFSYMVERVMYPKINRWLRSKLFQSTSNLAQYIRPDTKNFT